MTVDGWKSVCVSRSRVLLGSCTQGLCGQNVLFYSQGLPSVFNAGFLVHSVILCSGFIFLHTLNEAQVPSLLPLFLFSGSVVVKASWQQIVVYAVHIPLVLICFFTTVTDIWKIPCYGLYREEATLQHSRCAYYFTPLHNESGIITRLHYVLLFISQYNPLCASCCL